MLVKELISEELKNSIPFKKMMNILLTEEEEKSVKAQRSNEVSFEEINQQELELI